MPRFCSPAYRGKSTEQLIARIQLGPDPTRALADNVRLLEIVASGHLQPDALLLVASKLVHVNETNRISDLIQNGPAWLQLGFIDALLRWVNDEMSTCSHSPRVDDYVVVHASASFPGLVVCGRCASLLDLQPDSAADRTCDQCGRFDPEGVFGGVVSYGPLVYRFGVCIDCRTDFTVNEIMK